MYGARRMGTLMSIPAFPRANHAKPSGPCVTSIATHNAATPGAAHQRRIRIPASSAKNAMCSAFVTANKVNTAQPAASPMPP